MKKPEVNAEIEPEPLRKEALQAYPAHEPDCTEMVRKSIAHVQQNFPMPYHTKDGVNLQNDICCNPVSEILASNDKGKVVDELRYDGRGGQQEDPGPSCPPNYNPQ